MTESDRKQLVKISLFLTQIAIWKKDLHFMQLVALCITADIQFYSTLPHFLLLPISIVGKASQKVHPRPKILVPRN